MDITSELDQIALFGPLMAGHVLNVYFSALVVKKLSGVELNDAVRAETLEEVLSLWNNIQGIIAGIPRKKVVVGTSSDR